MSVEKEDMTYRFSNIQAELEKAQENYERIQLEAHQLKQELSATEERCALYLHNFGTHDKSIGLWTLFTNRVDEANGKNHALSGELKLKEAEVSELAANQTIVANQHLEELRELKKRIETHQKKEELDADALVKLSIENEKLREEREEW